MIEKKQYKLTDKDRKIIEIGTRMEKKLVEIQEKYPGSDRHKKFLERFYSWDRNTVAKKVRIIAFEYGILNVGSNSYYMMNGRPFPYYKTLQKLPMITSLS